MSVRRRGFWAGWGGWLTTIAMGTVVVALLVGWVLLWVNRPEGPSMSLLVLGCLAFAGIIAMLATLQVRLQKHWRLRQAEAVFLTGISHNLKTPISGIRAAAQALTASEVDADRRELLLNAIVAETRRLSLRVDNVLETGRLEVERRGTESVLVDVAQLVDATVRDLRPVIETQGGTMHVDGGDPLWVEGDSHGLRLLIDNLVDNALKYSDGKPTLSMSLGTHDGFCHLRIADDGVGFDPDRTDVLFQRFQRGDTGRSGSGLGLPLARAIAQGHGGDVHVHSDGVGLGAVAEVWLPLAQGEHHG